MCLAPNRKHVSHSIRSMPMIKMEACSSKTISPMKHGKPMDWVNHA
ncbi:MAG TPA: CRISPR-associated DxTHG motif protein [Epsilonproteobacteria bacterium]|nr:CRISPR-associated DxTHG motif protein [Campylobacterota bacterium]